MSISRLMQTASGKRGFDPNTPIGTAIEGGFFAGIITQGGDDYAIIVAPKSGGESTQQYKTSQTASPAATQTLNNGFDATAAMVSAGSHPAASFCSGLTIGSFADWYLPARDELEILYRNLKPRTQSNTTSARQLSSITYPEGNDVSGDTMGRNRNSNPLGAAYASGNPAQTSVSDFVQDAAQVFDATDYWSSTEFSDTSCWTQTFFAGGQFSSFKTNSKRTRAIRRVAI